MKVFRDPVASDLPENFSCVATIGFFDGVHLGHQTIFDRTKKLAENLGVQSVVVTFDPHPAQVLRPASAPLLITSLEQKLELIENSNIDVVVIISFSASQARETGDDFANRLLVQTLRVKQVIVGSDFHFGYKRSGSVASLRALGEGSGFDVLGLTLLARPDGKSEAVSSTSIRRALAGGEVKTATRMLGRFHEVRGVVVDGDKRGRTIGFPTANILVDSRCALPADAVYAGFYTRPDGSRHACAINIGKRPTFHQNVGRSLLEAHIIDFSASLYGEVARIEFLTLLRSEKRFSGVEELKKQLAIDIEQVREVVKEATF